MKKKGKVTATTLVCMILTLVLLAGINIGYLRLSSGQEFLAEELPSTLVENGETRRVSDGNEGFLTYGPYLSLPSGTHTVTIYYQTDSDTSYVDICADAGQTQLAKAFLEPEKTELILSVDAAEGMAEVEIRTFYDGDGYLEVDRIHVQSDTDLRAIFGAMLIMNVTIITAAGFALSVSLRPNTQKKTGLVGICNRINEWTHTAAAAVAQWREKGKPSFR